MCPAFCLIISGKKALSVQKWASVLTENVLLIPTVSFLSRLDDRDDSLLLNVLWGKVHK